MLRKTSFLQHFVKSFFLDKKLIFFILVVIPENKSLSKLLKKGEASLRVYRRTLFVISLILTFELKKLLNFFFLVLIQKGNGLIKRDVPVGRGSGGAN